MRNCKPNMAISDQRQMKGLIKPRLHFFHNFRQFVSVIGIGVGIGIGIAIAIGIVIGIAIETK